MDSFLLNSYLKNIIKNQSNPSWTPLEGEITALFDLARKGKRVKDVACILRAKKLDCLKTLLQNSDAELLRQLLVDREWKECLESNFSSLMKKLDRNPLLKASQFIE